ncbi:MAG: hypothetical protein JWL62_3792, partial [Hyphomicrobiales bacterium]|nr:hypothetical protein [Hyphomicrobiales bacterium]
GPFAMKGFQEIMKGMQDILPRTMRKPLE